MRTSQQKILVVDDDQAVTRSIDRVLSQKGYAVITAASGEEALAKLANEHYDAVYTDIRMPGMNGVEVAQRVKASQPWMPVVIMTGYGTEDYARQAEKAGVTQFLDKPLTPEMIERSAELALQVEEVSVPAVEVTAPVMEAETEKSSQLKNIFLFALAPFIGLAYIIAMPFVGLGVLAYLLGKAMWANKTGKAILTGIAVPFVSLAFVTVGPIVGLGTLAYMSGKAALRQ